MAGQGGPSPQGAGMTGEVPAVDTPCEILATGHQFAEAPREGPDGALYSSDLTGGGLYRWYAGVVTVALADRMWIGGCVMNVDGRPIVSGRGGLAIVGGGRAAPLLQAIGGAAVSAINDIEADAAGGLYGGTIDFTAILETGAPPAPGLFFRLDPDGSVDVLREGVAVSNGIGFSPAGDLLYHSESGVGVWAWTHDGHRPRDPQLFAALDDSDGLAVDAEGGVWVARWRAGELLRYRADAVLDRRIRLAAVPNIVSLTFAGPDLTDLIVATGGADASGAPVGGIVRIRSDVPGLRPHVARFA
ncbi:SMP-30/gluconolactonase/LRE family protein [Sphingomonas profundi]|uniref:SMP-30/gluconolactonase/LRE family protein n=1 Tax=Alterirhizorhabdus profundi TaxID=2681549 RepID=UPI0012E8F1B5|nr:SMP-30/gluconolactonase/LRE family protein [Sphingomonas profundi]